MSAYGRVENRRRDAIPRARASRRLLQTAKPKKSIAVQGASSGSRSRRGVRHGHMSTSECERPQLWRAPWWPWWPWWLAAAGRLAEITERGKGQEESRRWRPSGRHARAQRRVPPQPKGPTKCPSGKRASAHLEAWHCKQTSQP